MVITTIGKDTGVVANVLCGEQALGNRQDVFDGRHAVLTPVANLGWVLEIAEIGKRDQLVRDKALAYSESHIFSLRSKNSAASGLASEGRSWGIVLRPKAATLGRRPLRR